MGFETDFSFQHTFAADITKAPDLLGLLRGFVGNQKTRTWKGTGFNLIWRPNFNGTSGPKDFFLELNLTEETLEFTNITGNGIANRGFLQKDIALGGVAYLQQVTDRIEKTKQHFEPGVWANVPSTTNPAEPATVVRMGSIPHGTTIQMQGTSLEAPTPQIDPTTITPFVIGSPDDGTTGLVHFPEEDLNTSSTSRTPAANLPGLAASHLTNPNLFLTDALSGLEVIKTAVLIVNSDSSLPSSVPRIGGGVDNIAFLTGLGTPPSGGPNALSPRASAIFWIEEVKDTHGQTLHQIQYTQRVLLNFNGLSWPHISVATLRSA